MTWTKMNEIYHYGANLSFEDFKKIKTSYELHELARHCRFHVQQWIVDSELCSKATALMIFWDTHPYDFLNYSWNAKKNSVNEDFELIRTIINNFEKGTYLDTDIRYDPTEVIAKAEKIPDILLQASQGEEPYVYIDKKEVQSWFGDTLDSKIHQYETTIELYNIAVSLKHREIEVYEKIIDHPLCDKAIALMTYWLLDKYSHSPMYAEEWLSIKPLIDKIVQRLQNGDYPEILSYDPNKEVKPIKWKIPGYMFERIG